MTNPAALPSDSPLRRAFRSSAFRALAALVFVLLLGALFNADGTFFHWNTHRDMLRHISVFGILACGMTLVILAAGIDLAVGSILGFTAVLFSLLSLQLGWPPLLAVPAALAAGAACGLASGSLIAKFKLQPFIATLAMMVFARGLAKWISGGRKISTAVQVPDGTFQYREVPEVFRVLNSKLFGENIAVVTLIFLACVLIGWIILSRLRLGRHIIAVGGNEEAARLSGVSVARTKLFAYSFSGLMCAVAGHLPGRPGAAGRPGSGRVLRADRDRHRRHRRDQPDGRKGRHRADPDRGDDHRLSGEDPEHQRRRRSHPADADRPDHRRSRAVPEGPEVKRPGPGSKEGS